MTGARSARDDFPLGIKRTIAERAAHRCSNPDCRKVTAKPHTDQSKVNRLGVAAHIYGAASGGPRYRDDQTPAERKSADNAIWLCHSCSDLVDKDPARYTAEVLLEWRRGHDAFVSGGMVPHPPKLTLSSAAGFLLLDPVTDASSSSYRERTLQIFNEASVPLHDLRLHFRFPEVFEKGSIMPGVGGANARVRRFAVLIPVEITGDAVGLEVGTPAQITVGHIFRVTIERLMPRSLVVVRVLSSVPTDGLATSTGYVEKEGVRTLLHYMQLSYQYEAEGAYFSETQVRGLSYDLESRRVELVAEIGAVELDDMKVKDAAALAYRW